MVLEKNDFQYPEKSYFFLQFFHASIIERGIPANNFPTAFSFFGSRRSRMVRKLIPESIKIIQCCLLLINFLENDSYLFSVFSKNMLVSKPHFMCSRKFFKMFRKWSGKNSAWLTKLHSTCPDGQFQRKGFWKKRVALDAVRIDNSPGKKSAY